MENTKVTESIKKFLQDKIDKDCELIFKEAIKNLIDGINKSEDSEVKENAKRIIETKKTKEQSAIDDIRLKYRELCRLKYKHLLITVGKKNNKKEISFDEFKSLTLDEVSQINKNYAPDNWINYVSEKAGEVSLNVTHIAKLTHSSANASNINVNAYCSQSFKPLLVTANYSSKLPIDFAYSTPKYAPVAKFLQLDCEKRLLAELICRDSSLLKPFAKDDNQLKQWQEQISLAFNEKRKCSHQLVKQVYFPVNGDYHLLMPMTSSTMAQLIYDRVFQTRQKDNVVRKARKENLFNYEIDISYKTAVLMVTQSNHQNASYLNSKRSGKLLLFPCMSPVWKRQSKPPANLNTFFSGSINYHAKQSLQKLQNLLLAIKSNKLSLNLQRKQYISSLITEIADVVFDNVVQIQELRQDAGWSQESKLPIHQQYWLDPFRTDEDFQVARKNVAWQTDILNDFSKWINRQIKHEQLTLGIPQEKQWKTIFSPLLREFNAMTEVALEEVLREVEA